MNILKKIFKWAHIRPKDRFPGVSYPIKEAFVSDGIKYYQFDDQFNVPCERALKYSTFYAEMSMRIDYEYMTEHVKQMEIEFGKANEGKRPDLYRMKAMNDYLKARLAWIVDTDLVYKLASIVYFDENESPLTYDFSYNQKKIERWKKSMGVNDFFYSAPILRLIPFLKDLDLNLEVYSTVTAQQKDQMLTNITAN